MAYWPPEKFSMKPYDVHNLKDAVQKSDLWSIGIILLEMYFHQNPILFLSGLGESAEFPELQNYMLSVLPFYDIAEIMDRIGMKDSNSPVHEVIRLCLQPAYERYNFKGLMYTFLYTHLVKDAMKSFTMEDYSRAIVSIVNEKFLLKN